MKRFTIAALLALAAAPAAAQIAVSANENKVVNVAGAMSTVVKAAPDSVSVIDMSVFPPRIAGEVQVPTSVVGPPASVAVAQDETFALVTRDGDNGITLLAVDGDKVTATNRTFYAGIRPYGADITPDGRYAVVANVGRGQGDNDTASLIDLSMNPPRTVDTITVGPSPEGLKISPNGKYAAVVVRNGSAFSPTSPFYNAFGKVVLLGISAGRLTRLSEERVGRWSQGAAFTPDSQTLLVQNMVEKDIQVFRIELDQLRDTWHRIKLPGGGAGIGTAY